MKNDSNGKDDQEAILKPSKYFYTIFQFKNFHNIFNLNNNRKKNINYKLNSYNKWIKITNNIC